MTSNERSLASYFSTEPNRLLLNWLSPLRQHVADLYLRDAWTFSGEGGEKLWLHLSEGLSLTFAQKNTRERAHSTLKNRFVLLVEPRTPVFKAENSIALLCNSTVT